MAEVLLRIADTQFWVLADTVTETILHTYKKSQVEADIAAIQATLQKYPDPAVMEEDLQALIWLVNNYKDATAERKARVIAMLQEMWQAFQDEPKIFDGAALRARLVDLRALLARMV